ncbi:MAG: T9SS type A sorting domain-containing protein [Melioribacteraceae bacterium]
MSKIIIKVFFIIAILNIEIISQIYVAPNGNDSNPGTIDKPLESLQKAQELVKPGDTVFIRGGLYKIRPNQISKVVSNLFACITYLDKSGTEGNTIKYWAYPGETPVFDFSDVKPANQRVVGVYVIGNYIHLKGLEMTGIQVTITGHTESYCIYSRGNHNIFENISMHDNVGTGLRHYKGGYNLFLNCDAYRNWDNVSEDKLGSNTDGFGCHPDAGGKGNIFKGCRAWFNSDDGFDIIRADESVVFDSCWSFYNGYSTSFEKLGDGNGFKAGGFAHDTADKIPNPVPKHIIKFCIAVGNKANGFYSNHHLNGNEWYNNTAYQNDVNFNMVNRESPQIDNIWFNGYDHILINNLSYKPVSSHTAYIDNSKNTLSHNSFDSELNISDDDFVSLDISQLTAPRKPDGNLPDIDFMRPSPNSILVDAGLDVGFNFTGSAPDLGALESRNSTSVNYIENNIPDEIELYQNYPNPFNAFTNFVFKIPFSSHVKVLVYNSLGEKICTLIDEFKNRGTHTIRFDGNSLPSGIYFCNLNVNGKSITKQFILLK